MKFEIVVCFAGDNKENYNDYVSSMPWKAFPFDSSGTNSVLYQLGEFFDVTHVPHLTMIEYSSAGPIDIINKNASAYIENDFKIERFPWKKRILVLELADDGPYLTKDKPCVLLLQDGRSELYQEKTTDWLTQVAEDDEIFGNKYGFYTVNREDERSSWAFLLRKMTFLNDEDNKMILLDLQNRLYCAKNLPENVEEINQLIADHGEEALEFEYIYKKKIYW